MNIKFSSWAINTIIVMSLTFPTLQIVSGIYLHRIPYLLAGIFAIIAVFYRGYIYKSYLMTFVLIFSITFTGLLVVGTKYTAFMNPVIYGLFFYVIMGKLYKYNFIRLYKLLTLLLLLEFLIINLINYNAFGFLKNDLIHSYTALSSKITPLTGIYILPPNSIYYGVQVASVLMAISVIIFRDHLLWKYISIFLFSVCFSLTSIVMIATGMVIINFKKYFPALILSLFILIYIFYSESLNFDKYYSTFSAFPISWWERPINEKLFGYPHSPVYSWSWELGYFFIIKNLGLINVLVLGIMNIILVVKRRNIHSVIVTMLHVSLLHYHPALGLGLSQLFGLHIAHAMRENNHY